MVSQSCMRFCGEVVFERCSHLVSHLKTFDLMIIWISKLLKHNEPIDIHVPDNEKGTSMWPQMFNTQSKMHHRLSFMFTTSTQTDAPWNVTCSLQIFSRYKKILFFLEVTRTRSLVTSYLAADMFFRRDDLVHVGSQSGVQRSSLDLTGLHQCVILTGGLRQHLPVHRIRNLEGESRFRVSPA